MIFNLLNSLTDPDNIPSAYGGYDLNNGGLAIIITLLVIILIMLTIILVLRVKLKNEKNKTNELKLTDLSEEEKHNLTEFRKLTEQERQIINDTIKTFNRSKNE